MAALLVMCFALITAPVRADDTDAAARDAAWLLGNWQVEYQDAVLGRVEGRAAVVGLVSPSGVVEPSHLAINVSVVHPRTGKEYSLRATDIDVANTTADATGAHGHVRMTLVGQSPWGGAATMSYPPGQRYMELTGDNAFTVTDLWLRMRPGETLTARIDEAAAHISGDLGEGEPATGELQLELTRRGEGDQQVLEGEWSYEDPGEASLRGRRAGQRRRHTYEVFHRETWRRAPGPVIQQVETVTLDPRHLDVREDLDFDLAALRGKHGDDITGVAWLRLTGQALPTGDDQLADIAFEDDAVVWTGRRRSVQQPTVMEIEVALQRDIEAGWKRLIVNGSEGMWRFAFPTPSSRAGSSGRGGATPAPRRGN